MEWGFTSRADDADLRLGASQNDRDDATWECSLRSQLDELRLWKHPIRCGHFAVPRDNRDRFKGRTQRSRLPVRRLAFADP